MPRDIRLRFARRLRALRRRCGWTQEELAERAELAYRHVQRLESLTNPPPAKIDTLEKLAKAFKVSPAKLLTFDQWAGSLTGALQGASAVAEPRARLKSRRRPRTSHRSRSA